MFLFAFGPGVEPFVAASAFHQVGKAGALLHSHYHGSQQQLTSSNRFLAGTVASRGLAHRFITGAFPTQAAAGDGGSAVGILVDQMKQKVGVVII